MVETLEIREFDGKNATERGYAAWNDLGNRLQAEAWPEDPPITLERTIRSQRSKPAFMEERQWAVWSRDGGAIVARAGVQIWHIDSNEHVAGCHLAVGPEWRRQGLGRRLLARVVDAARGWNRRLLITGTINVVPAGEAFLRRLGAQPALTSWVNQLDLEELDPDLLRCWQERGRERTPGFEFGLWAGPYPEEALEEVVAMKEAVNLMPRGDLDVEDFHMTAEQLRQIDASAVARGDERWTLYARDPETGRIAGYTEVWWNPERPEILHQDDTAVFPEYQNRGLGRWLKAVMLEKVLRERPQVKRVRTGNAQSNAPMLKINTEMGFKPYRAHTEWQVEITKVEDYLTSR
jgi:GNAT superfamily N-acetyltransferase